MPGEKVMDHRRINYRSFSQFRAQCLRAKMSKHWVSTEEDNPEYSGLFFIKHDDFLGDIDIAEFFINKKGEKFWLTPGDPTHWSEIETYDYFYEDGTPVYNDEYIG